MTAPGPSTIARRLSAPYRARSGDAERWGMAACAGIFVFLFLFVFRPFGLTRFPDELLALTLGYGACTFVVMVVLNVFLVKIMPRFFDPGSWTTGREIIWNLVNLLVITMANVAFTVYSGLAAFGIKTALVFLFYTVAVGFFPITAGILINAMRMDRVNRRLSKEMGEELSTREKGTGKGEPELVISSLNTKDNLTLPLGNLLFMAGADNYVEVHYLQGKELKRHLVRNTMKQLEQLTGVHRSLIRCHKSYIVNLDHVMAVKGNAQGCHLELDSHALKVPASRQLRQALKNRLAVRP